MNFAFNNGRFAINAWSNNDGISEFYLSIVDKNTQREHRETYSDYERAHDEFKNAVKLIITNQGLPQFAGIFNEQPFHFDSEDIGLSSNPSLTSYIGEDQYYIVYDKAIDDQGGRFISGFIADGNNNGGEELEFDTLDQAIDSMAMLYGIKPSKSTDFKNFQNYIDIYSVMGCRQ